MFGCWKQKHFRRRDPKKAYLLINFDADCTLGNVPDAAGAAVVELVGHALVNGTVNLDVDIIPDLEGPEICSERDVTLLPEGPSEQIPRPRSKTVTRRHSQSLSTPSLHPRSQTQPLFPLSACRYLISIPK